MPRLRRSDPGRPGLTRRRSGRGFVYLDAHGGRVTEEGTLARIRALAIPPAYADVWISPDPAGHIQAVGVDAAGRRQYRYHEVWQQNRSRDKHRRVLLIGERLPSMRLRWGRDLARPELDRPRVLAAAASLLDLGLFRVGGEEYAAEHNTFGLATLRREHVRVRGGALVFDYVAKAGVHRVETVGDTRVRDVVVALRRRRDENPELFAYRSDGSWVDVRSTEINSYLREMSGLDMSAKDFRTWHATVLMAALLARATPVPRGVTARRRVVRQGFVEVSEALGNTPAVCRTSYVDPRVVDLYHDGVTVGPPRGRPRTDGGVQAALEREVLALLRDDG